RGCTTREMQLAPLGTPPKERPRLAQRDPAPVDRIGDLVEHHELVLPRLDDLPGATPRLGGDGTALVHVLRVPGEPVAERPPVHPELTGDLLLADAPFSRLEELDDRHLPAAGDGAHHGPERCGRLPLPVTGVDEDERRCAFGRPGRRCRGRIGGHDPILRGSTAGPSGPSTTLTAPP